MSLLRAVCEVLDELGVPHAVIGAMALAARGVPRATADLDLLAIDTRCLRDETWAPLRARRIDVEVRVGDEDDPLAGVVRIEQGAELPVEVVVGKPAWQKAVIERATPLELMDTTVPVVEAADLVLLKLYAGGPQDLADIAALLEQHEPDAELRADVEARLVLLPERCRLVWRAIVSERGG